MALPEEAETGPAQTPAVTDIRQDVADFDSRFGLPPARIQVITTLAGPSASPWLASEEEVEDTELVHAVAPDATIREILVGPADVSTPAKFAVTFASYVRIAVRYAEVISQCQIGEDFSVGEDSWTSAEAATMNSALEYAAPVMSPSSQPRAARARSASARPRRSRRSSCPLPIRSCSGWAAPA